MSVSWFIFAGLDLKTQYSYDAVYSMDVHLLSSDVWKPFYYDSHKRTDAQAAHFPLVAHAAFIKIKLENIGVIYLCYCYFLKFFN